MLTTLRALVVTILSAAALDASALVINYELTIDSRHTCTVTNGVQSQCGFDASFIPVTQQGYESSGNGIISIETYDGDDLRAVLMNFGQSAFLNTIFTDSIKSLNPYANYSSISNRFDVYQAFWHYQEIELRNIYSHYVEHAGPGYNYRMGPQGYEVEHHDAYIYSRSMQLQAPVGALWPLELDLITVDLVEELLAEAVAQDWRFIFDEQGDIRHSYYDLIEQGYVLTDSRSISYRGSGRILSYIIANEVPEPGTGLLMLIGIAGAAACRRKPRRVGAQVV